ncbi:MAG: tetratricopeptide repeat protein [Planctomycetes bacterium]|nr:tetratricopeptide repeat protein [Planctomycetota bacterium]
MIGVISRHHWRQPALVAALLLCAGCVAVEQERIREYNEDGIYLFRRGDYVAARESFKAALALEPEDPGLMYNIGECHDRLGKAEKAEKFYKECLLRVPNHPDCRHALTVLLVRQGRRPEAQGLVNDWMAREPGMAAPYAEDGWLLHEAGDLPRARTRLQQALDIDPHDVRTLTELARVYEDMNRPDRALVLYEQALERDPRRTELTERVNFLLAKGAGRPRPD